MHPEAKAVILRRIRTATQRETHLEEARSAWHAIARAYNRVAKSGCERMLTLLEDRLRDYDAIVEQVARKDCAAAVERVLAAQPGMRTVMPVGVAPDLLPAGHNIVLDEQFSHRELDRFGAVLTEATLAIAETGTLVLQGVAGQGRRAATLVPDFHLCLVDISTVVATVPEALDRLRATARLPTTFVSGPSATADIEMTRIKGVHGPRFLHVLLVR